MNTGTQLVIALALLGLTKGYRLPLAFSAVRTTDYSVPSTASGVVPFGILELDVSQGAYDPITGVFTAPTWGIYEFHWAMRGTNVHLHLRKNGQDVGQAFTGTDGYWPSASNSAMVQLQAGDKVDVFYPVQGLPGPHMFCNIHRACRFSAKLL